MTKELQAVMQQWNALTTEYKALQARLKDVRGLLSKLKFVGHYRPQVELSFCQCGAGPFSARELRKHKCKG